MTCHHEYNDEMVCTKCGFDMYDSKLISKVVEGKPSIQLAVEYRNAMVDLADKYLKLIIKMEGK